MASDLFQADPHFITVGPNDISGFYDFAPVDGTLPIDMACPGNICGRKPHGFWRKCPRLRRIIHCWHLQLMAQLAGLQQNITQFRLLLMLLWLSRFGQPILEAWAMRSALKRCG